MNTGEGMRNKGVSIVLGSFNRLKFLKLTIESIRKELTGSPFPAEIIVVDGGSTDGTLKWLIKQKDVITIVQHNRGEWHGENIERRSWGYFMNLGFKCAQGKYICMLSDDCLVVPGAIVNGYKLFEDELNKDNKTGAVAFYWRNGTPEPIYYVSVFANVIFVNHGMYLKSALDEVSYVDEENFQFYSADIDLCLKLWEKGYLCLESPNSYIEHYPHANVTLRIDNEKVMDGDYHALIRKWKHVVNFEGVSKDQIHIMKGKEFIDKSRIASSYRKAILIQLLTKDLLFKVRQFFGGIIGR